MHLCVLRGDPAAEYNLIETKPEIAKRLERQLRDWQQSVLHSLTGAAGIGPTFVDLYGHTFATREGTQIVADDNYIRESIVEPMASIRAGYERWWITVKWENGMATGDPDLLAAGRAAAKDRRSAIEAVREEVRRVLLGYDADRERSERLSEFLEAPLPDRLSEAFRRELAYPPLAHLVCVGLKGPTESAVAFTAEHLARRLRKALPDGEIVLAMRPAALYSREVVKLGTPPDEGISLVACGSPVPQKVVAMTVPSGSVRSRLKVRESPSGSEQ